MSDDPEETSKSSGRAGKVMPLGRRFQPGQSGNPGGRPRVVADIRALSQLEGAACIEALIRVRDDPKSPAAAKVAAALAIMDRGYGKAIQRQEHTGADGGPIQTQQVADERMPVESFLAEFSKEKSSGTQNTH